VQVGYEEESHWGKPKAWDIKGLRIYKGKQVSPMSANGTKQTCSMR
jgi:hypothetical protein